MASKPVVTCEQEAEALRLLDQYMKLFGRTEPTDEVMRRRLARALVMIEEDRVEKPLADLK